MQPKNPGDDLVTFYEEQLCSMADAIYRFAFGVTLSPDRAKQVVKQAYEEAVARLEEVRDWTDREREALLIGACWRVIEADKSATQSPGSSHVAQVLGTLSAEVRVALLAIDVVGLTVAEAAKSLAWDEATMRERLAIGRRSLVTTSLSS